MRLISGLCRVGFAAILLYFVYLVLFPAPLVIKTTEAGGEIFFAANRSLVFVPGDCLKVEWTVRNIRAVFLDGQPQVGEGSAVSCLTPGVSPELRVTFQDGSERNYRLNVAILLTDMRAWALVLTALVLLILGFQGYRYELQWPLLQGLLTTRSLLTFVMAALTLYAFAAQIAPLIQSFVTATYWLDASNALATLITNATLLLFLVVIGIAGLLRLQKAPAFHFPTFIRSWSAGLGLMLVVIIVTIVYVNPRGMYPTTNYEPHQLILRSKKTLGYAALPQRPNLVIMGSSRTFTLSPAYIEELTGYSAYNMANEGGRIEDTLIGTRFMLDQHDHTLPEVLLIEVQEGLPRQSNDIALRAPFWWLRYLRPATAQLLTQKKFEALFELRHFAEALHIARYSQLYERLPKEWPGFEPDGAAIRPLIPPEELDRIIQINIGTIPPVDCTEVDPISQDEMNELITIAYHQHSSLVFYLSPWHPRYYDANMRDNPSYQHCYEIFKTYMETLTHQYDFVFFMDFSHLASIDGLDTTRGYYDSDHLAPANSRRLIDHASATISAAYTLAARLRGES